LAATLSAALPRGCSQSVLSWGHGRRGSAAARKRRVPVRSGQRSSLAAEQEQVDAGRVLAQRHLAADLEGNSPSIGRLIRPRRPPSLPIERFIRPIRAQDASGRAVDPPHEQLCWNSGRLIRSQTPLPPFLEADDPPPAAPCPFQRAVHPLWRTCAPRRSTPSVPCPSTSTSRRESAPRWPRR
jgi:hypothetical protein